MCMKKLRMTPARKAITELFSKGCAPMSAEGIKKILGKKFDQVTIYRTLHSFEREGLLRRVDLRKDAVYYELADHHHHHIVCTDCGATEHFSECAIGPISQKIVEQSKKFSTIVDHSFELFGRCRKCAKLYA